MKQRKSTSGCWRILIESNPKTRRNTNYAIHRRSAVSIEYSLLASWPVFEYTIKVLHTANRFSTKNGCVHSSLFHRWPDGKVSATGPKPAGSKPDSTEDPPCIWACSVAAFRTGVRGTRSVLLGHMRASKSIQRTSQC
ncbi:hypothetical protein AVEN_133594-1 [Araneus ventricosus]|uniref:Uncharacterized protein n=1 Tax=Araneus ventricosus TaxID=182803 RepID=A0A4Y2JHS7_ARAVE|nr:hypothetical protein AVEN_133594-1 [Araneus ventricosus]